ncbi:MAG: type II toxin-antitoxin system HicB family antitoxin [Alphaproteobacteria bacterium]|nr:MAG: type II toxin-antitoxin system HicB family antitoxin [Alphaproteobacteria bacterium]
MNLLTYKGYNAAVEFDADDLLLVGRIAGINDVVGFHGADAREIVAAFHEAVDDYLETCAEIGKTPERAYSGKLMIRTDPAVHAQAALAATIEGVSLNQFAERALKDCAEETVRRKAPGVA